MKAPFLVCKHFTWPMGRDRGNAFWQFAIFAWFVCVNSSIAISQSTTSDGLLPPISNSLQRVVVDSRDSISSAPILDVGDTHAQLEKRVQELESILSKHAEEEKKKVSEEARLPKVIPRGRLHTDTNWFHQSDANRNATGDLQDGAFIRRARLGFDATALEVTQYRLDFEMGAGSGRPSIFDAWGRLTDIPMLGNIQLGHMREPFSLEALTNTNWTTFIERSLNNTFDPARNWGLLMFQNNEAENATLAMGVFREGSDPFGDDIGDSGEHAFTTRATWMPVHLSDRRYFLEWGGSYSYRNPDMEFLAGIGGPERPIVRYQGRPEIVLGEDGVGSFPPLISVRVDDATNVQLFGFETSCNMGPLNLQSEFIGSLVQRGQNPSAFYHGSYAQASYFLTGESRQWNSKLGTFARAEVFDPLMLGKKGTSSIKGIGAWELTARWNYLDFTDPVQDQGYIDTTTIGLNWYLNPFVRMLFNVSHVDLHAPQERRSDLTLFRTRLDIHF